MVNVSVIIPAYNEEDYIKETLESVNNQTLNREEYEIILCDGESEDATVEVAEPLVDEIISTENKSIGANRNRGAEHAEGEILLFLDADTRMPENLLKEIIERVKSEEFTVAKPLVKIEYYSKTVALLNKIHNSYIKLMEKINPKLCLHIGGACIIVKKSDFSEIGGFREDIWRSEDNELIKRLMHEGRFLLIDEEVITSNRRFKKMGLINRCIDCCIDGFKYHFKEDYKGNYIPTEEK